MKRKDLPKDKMGKSKWHTVRILLAAVFATIVIFVGAIVGVLLAMRSAGRASFDELREQASIPVDSYEDDISLDPGCIRYKGKTYRYNDSLSSLLHIGVDRKELVSTEGVAASGGQADALHLFVLDEKNKKVTIIPIDRNTMTEIESFDASGESIGFSKAHIAYSYANGDGKEESCRLTCNAVSDLLYDIPIHAYFSMATSAIADINDAVGGVTVSITEDMTVIDKEFVKGNRVTLLGRQAEAFLCARTGVGDGRNESRIERQKRYVQAFIETAKSAFFKDLTLPVKIYRSVASKSYTNLSSDMMVYLATIAKDMNFVFRRIDGRFETNSTYAEFYPDSDSLFQMVLDVFYICED